MVCYDMVTIIVVKSNLYMVYIYIYIYIYIYTHIYGFDFKFNNTNSRIKCKTCSKLTIETIDIILVSLLFTLKIFDPLFIVFCFEHVNDRWSTSLP